MDTWAPYLSVSLMRSLLSVRPWLHCLRAVLIRLALAFLAVATTAFSLSFTERLQPGDEPSLPRCEVGLDAAVFAFNHVAVTLPSGHHAMGAEHPEPLVHVLPHLQEDETGELQQSSRSEAGSLLCDSLGFRWGPVPGHC